VGVFSEHSVLDKIKLKKSRLWTAS